MDMSVGISPLFNSLLHHFILYCSPMAIPGQAKFFDNGRRNRKTSFFAHDVYTRPQSLLFKRDPEVRKQQTGQ